MTDDFLRAHEQHVLQWEGMGCHQAPGETWQTCWGISQRDNPDLWQNGTPTKEQCYQRAYRNYWQASGADDMAPWMGLLHYDASFNMGTGRAAGILEAAGESLMRYSTQRILTYASFTRPVTINGETMTQWQAYGKGWANRTFAAYALAVEWQLQASGGPGIALDEQFDLGAVVLNDVKIPIPGFWEGIAMAIRGSWTPALLRLEDGYLGRVRYRTEDPGALKIDLAPKEGNA